MQQVRWPEQGNQRAYLRRVWACLMAGIVFVACAGTTVFLLAPYAIAPLLPLLTGMLIGWGLLSHSFARKHARDTEIVRSFAGLTVLHHDHALTVDADPLIGSWTTRTEAARAAIDLGHWAVLVRAYGRWYALSSSLAPRTSTPVSFRTRAVADVVPSMLDTAQSA